MKHARLLPRSIATVMFTAAMMASSAQALLIEMTVDLGSLGSPPGTPGVLAFDFNPGGGSTGNTVLLSPLTPPGDSTSIFGDITDLGTGQGWLFADTTIDELQVSYVALPSTVSFSFQTSDRAATIGVPDEFSFFILDSSAVASLITTDDPSLGRNALFVFDLGVGPNGLSVYKADQGVFVSGVSVDPNPSASVPEPGTLVLVVAGIAAAVGRARKYVPRG